MNERTVLIQVDGAKIRVEKSALKPCWRGLRRGHQSQRLMDSKSPPIALPLFGIVSPSSRSFNWVAGSRCCGLRRRQLVWSQSNCHAPGCDGGRWNWYGPGEPNGRRSAMPWPNLSLKLLRAILILLHDRCTLRNMAHSRTSFPAFIHYGLQILEPEIFLFAACIICGVLSLATGSSWGTVGTVGVLLWLGLVRHWD